MTKRITPKPAAKAGMTPRKIDAVKRILAKAPTPPAHAPAHHPAEFFQSLWGSDLWWRVWSDNGNKLAGSLQGYSRRIDAEDGFLAAADIMVVEAAKIRAARKGAKGKA